MILWGLVVLIFIISHQKNREQTLESLRRSLSSLQSLAPALLVMATFAGCVLAFFPKEEIAGIFSEKGWGGMMTATLMGAIITLPGPIAFPLAGSLLSLGVDQGVLASFITSLTMVGVASAPLEASQLGWRFTLTRQSLSFLGALMIGLAMGEFLK